VATGFTPPSNAHARATLREQSALGIVAATADAKATLQAIEHAWITEYVEGGVDPVVSDSAAVPSEEALRAVSELPLDELCAAASRVRDVGHRIITFSPKVTLSPSQPPTP
jgi:hypothetical protein